MAAVEKPAGALKPVELEDTLEYIPTPLVLVTAAADGRRNVMMAVRLMHWEEHPPAILVGVDGRSLTGELMQASGEFAVHVLAAEQAELLHRGRQLSRVSSEEVDKFEAFGLTTRPASVIQAPLIAGSAVSVECRLRHFTDIGDKHWIAIGDVVALHVDPERAPVLLRHRVLYPLREFIP